MRPTPALCASGDFSPPDPTSPVSPGCCLLLVKALCILGDMTQLSALPRPLASSFPHSLCALGFLPTLVMFSSPRPRTLKGNPLRLPPSPPLLPPAFTVHPAKPPTVRGPLVGAGSPLDWSFPDARPSCRPQGLGEIRLTSPSCLQHVCPLLALPREERNYKFSLLLHITQLLPGFRLFGFL